MTGADLKVLAKKHPISVVCGVISVICAVVLYFTGDTVDESRTLSDDKAKSAKIILNNVANSQGLQQQTEVIQHDVKEMESRLMHASQLATNLQHFYRLESDTGVKLVDVHQGSIESGKADYKAISFAVNIQGNFKQMLDFLQRLENGPRITRFTSLSFSKAGGENASPDQFSVSMGIDFLGTP